MQGLPDEILEMVISSLGEDLPARANLMLACKRIYQASKRRAVWDSGKKRVRMVALRASDHVVRWALKPESTSTEEIRSGKHRYLFESTLAREAGLFEFFGSRDYVSLALIAAASGVAGFVQTYCDKLLHSFPPGHKLGAQFLEPLVRVAVASGSPETLAAAHGPWGVDATLLGAINSSTGVLFRLAAQSGSVPMILALEERGLDMRGTPETVNLVLEQAALHGRASLLDFVAALPGIDTLIGPRSHILEKVVTPVLCRDMYWDSQAAATTLRWARLRLAGTSVRLPPSAFRPLSLHPVVRAARSHDSSLLAELISGNWLGGTQAEILEALRSHENGALRESVLIKNTTALGLLRAAGLTSDDARAQSNYALWSVFWYPARGSAAVLRLLRQQWGLGPKDLEGLRAHITTDFFKDVDLLRELRKHWDGARILGIGPQAAAVQATPTLQDTSCHLCVSCLGEAWEECMTRPRMPFGILDMTSHATVLEHAVTFMHPDTVSELRLGWGFLPEHVRANLHRVLWVVVDAGQASMLRALREQFGLDAGDVRPTLVLAAAVKRGHHMVVKELREGFGLGVEDARAVLRQAVRGAWVGENGGVAGAGVKVLRELALFGLTGADARENNNELLITAIANAQQDLVVELSRAPWGLGAPDLREALMFNALGRMDALVSPSAADQARGVAVFRALRLLYGLQDFAPQSITPLVIHLTRLMRRRSATSLPRQLVDEFVELGLDRKEVSMKFGVSGSQAF